MATGFPDWTRAIVLLGWDGTNFIPVLLDEDGNLNILMKGEDALGDLHMVRVDDSGQMITVLRGATGNYVAVDASGFMTAVMKGDKGAGELASIAVDDDGQLIMVPRGETGNYLNVDADGFMTTVIKGNAAAGLTTVWVDGDGRLMAFPVDEMDVWDQYVALGNAELAARLGSPVSYERSGQVQLMESFENGRQLWLESISGTGSATELDPTTAKTGGYSIKLTGGSTLGRSAKVYMTKGLLPIGRMGLALSFAIPTWFESLTILLQQYTGTTYYFAGVRFNHAGGQIQLLNSLGNWTNMVAFTIYPREKEFWSTMKLVVDLTENEYDKLRWNASEYDWSAYPMKSGGSAEAARVRIEVELISDAAENDIAYLDDIILTGSEP